MTDINNSDKFIIIGVSIYALGAVVSVAIMNIGFALALLGWIIRKFKNNDFKIKSTPYDKLIIFFLLITGLAFVRNYNLANSFKRFWDPILLFYIVVDFNPKMKIIKRWLVILAIAMLGSIVYSFWQYRIGVNRVHGNIFVMEFADLLSFFAIYAITYSLWGEIQFKYKFLYGFVGIMAISSLILTQTRGVWIAFIVSLVIIILALVKEKKDIINFLIVVVLISVVLYYFLPDQYINRFMSIFDIKNNLSNVTRINLWKGTIEIYKDHWLLGVGLDNFSKVITKEAYFHKPMVSTVHAHNNFFQLAAEVGIFGLVSFVILFGKILYSLYCYYKVSNNQNLSLFFLCTFGIVISFLVHGVTEYNLRDMFVGRLLWFMIGICLVLKNQILTALD